MLQVTKTFCRKVKREEPPVWLSLLGSSGIGKSHMADEVWEWLKGRDGFNRPSHDHYPVKLYWPKFIEQLRDLEGPAKRMLIDAMSWKYVYIDDIFAERDSTGFSVDMFAKLIGARHNRFTIITSNKHLHEIEEIDVRMSDRILRGELVADCELESWQSVKRNFQT
jgi:DNA replication protein DnaC